MEDRARLLTGHDLREAEGHGCRGDGCENGEPTEGVPEISSLRQPISPHSGQLRQEAPRDSSDEAERKCPAGSKSQQEGVPKTKESSARASRTRLSLAKKLEVLRLLDEKVAYSDVCLQFGCSVSAIRKMKRERRQLELDAASCARRASSKSSRGVGLPEVSCSLLHGRAPASWVLHQKVQSRCFG